jgi:hypothetical protein
MVVALKKEKKKKEKMEKKNGVKGPVTHYSYFTDRFAQSTASALHFPEYNYKLYY